MKRGNGSSHLLGETKMNNINKPVHEIRLGSVRAAIWANQTQNGIRHSVTLSRSYKADTGWKKTNTYGRDDLPALEKVAELAQVWIFTHEGAELPQLSPQEVQETDQDVVNV
jgi:hypothetical protein